MKKLVIGISLSIFAHRSFCQESTNMDSIVSKIEVLMKSQSAIWNYDLKEVNLVALNRLVFLNDSAMSKRFGIQLAKQTQNQLKAIRQQNFIANKWQNWRSTDLVTQENENSPARKFIAVVTQVNSLIIFYWHGGIEIHLHAVYVELTNSVMMRGFVLHGQNGAYRKLDRKRRLSDSQKRNFLSLVLGCLKGSTAEFDHDMIISK